MHNIKIKWNNIKSNVMKIILKKKNEKKNNK